MIHTLYLEVVPASTIGIEHLWKEGMVALLDDLYMSYGIGTDDGEMLSSATERGFNLFPRLAPDGSGELLISVNEEQPPFYVLYTLRDGILTESDYGAVVKRVGTRLRDEWRLSAGIETNQPDDLAARPFDT